MKNPTLCCAAKKLKNKKNFNLYKNCNCVFFFHKNGNSYNITNKIRISKERNTLWSINYKCSIPKKSLDNFIIEKIIH